MSTPSMDSRRSRHSRCFAVACACIVAASLPPTATAQQTRADELRREQAAKSAALSPSTKNRAERVIDRMRTYGLFEADPVGFYPILSTVYPSGGMAVGGGYRNPFRDTGAVTATAALSVRNYKSAGLGVELPRIGRGRVAIDAGLNWIDAPSVPYYGLGDDARLDGRTTFRYQPATLGVGVRYDPVRAITIGGGVDYLQISAAAESAAGEGTLVGRTIPGLDDDPSYVHARAFATVNWRSAPGFTGSGGLYRVAFDDYADLGDSHLSFRRVESEVVQLVPVLRANWVIALRGLATVTQAADADAVPFYLMPTLGGGRDLRGFATMRFRGPQRVLVSAELRWTPARILDMAIFYDAGKVADRARDLTLGALNASYGIGARFHGQGGTIMRWDLAHSREHALRFVWSFGAAF